MGTSSKPYFKLSEAISCPDCGQNVILYDLPRSEFTICSFCRSYFQIVGNDLKKQKKQLDGPQKQPLLKLGATANIHGVDLKVIAYLEKKEAGTDYNWREYILTSHNKGYVTISEFNGHWNLIAGPEFLPDFKQPISYGNSVGYKDVEYKLFNHYTPAITAMLGELDWDVLNEKVKATEYIAPPFMVVKEIIGKSNGLTNYYIGEYLQPDEIAAAFGLNIKELPVKTGIGANEPSKAYDRWIPTLQISIIAMLVVLGLHFAFEIFKPEKDLINDDFAIQFDGKTDPNSFKPFITPSFNVEDYSSNIEFNISANVDNNWFETTIVLVNEKDNRTWEVSKGIEYYHGYEDGEKWSEGSTTEKVMVAGIPKGKYHLNVYPASGDTTSTNLYIKATANSSMWRNTLLTMLAFAIFPAISWYLMRNYEKRRWSNSDYSPFVND
ncbi:DUF4178 domain-containing protein [Pedobacter frigidisoli]|uniref:DUF4178 domain-containing protein n=1 Tax=Pedobacter frigidisoli TaxID=2530455 RepID=UPI0029303584|nr:DUF4178 domain-containing protein [Pedobacter frigidisoli]